MVPDRQKVWTDGGNGRTDDAKTISHRLRRGIISWICFISFLYLDVYVLGDDRSIS